jgi:hypothetical protein
VSADPDARARCDRVVAVLVALQAEMFAAAKEFDAVAGALRQRVAPAEVRIQAARTLKNGDHVLARFRAAVQEAERVGLPEADLSRLRAAFGQFASDVEGAWQATREYVEATR